MREKLELAQRDARVVSIDRAVYDEEDEIGYVIAVGEALFLLARIAETIHLDGFSILRVEDVSHVAIPHDHEDFVESALRLRSESIVSAPDVDLDDWPEALRSAGRQVEVVTLHTEASEADVCRIGRLRTANEETVSLVEIDPDADWYDGPSSIPTVEITRVDFGGAYEEALVLVGGPCPVPVLRPVD